MSAPSTDEIPSQDLTLTVESPAAGGSSIARHEGQVVFVTGAIPGERVRARTEAGPAAKFLRADVTEVLEPSEFRVPDRRPAYLVDAANGPLFGGMEFAHVDLAHSRNLKAEVLGDQLSRIGHLDRDVSVTAAPEESTGTDWRTRVQMAVDPAGRLGMRPARSHDVVPLRTAPLACPAIAEVDLSELRLPGADRLEFAWAGDHGAVIVRGDCDPTAVEKLASALPSQWSILAEGGGSSQVSAHRGKQRSGAGRNPRPGKSGRGRLDVVRGQDFLTERVDDRDYLVAADGFWQVHDQAPEVLSGAVRSALQTDTTSITDLYCGVGLLGISAATNTGAELYGVEGVKSAIVNAKANARGLTAEFEAVRADRAVIPASSDAIILDPPRSGAGKAVTKALIGSSASTIVYVSCDAATLARDLGALTAGGFVIESLRGFDLFPLTAHLETVTVLRR